MPERHQPPKLGQPPRLALAILNFFRHQPDFASISGDLDEEFHQRAAAQGPRAARLWFWRETLRNAWALTAREILRTPLRTLGIAFACLLAINLATALYPLAVRLTTGEFLDSILFDYGHQHVIILIQFAAPLAIGWLGARLNPGREWALALVFTLLSVFLTALGLVYLAAVLHWRGWAALDPLQAFALVGNVVRHASFWLGALWSRRSRAATTHAA